VRAYNKPHDETQVQEKINSTSGIHTTQMVVVGEEQLAHDF
jgi:hypothetical protein